MPWLVFLRAGQRARVRLGAAAGAAAEDLQVSGTRGPVPLWTGVQRLGSGG